MASHSTLAPPSSTGHARNVLLVEDDLVLARALKRSLAGLGFTVDHSDGKDFAEHLMKEKYYAIVSDIHLGDTTGIDVLTVARSYDDTIPFILMTGQGTFDTARSALNLGADSYLLKPVSGDDLVSAIETCAVQRRRLRPMVDVAGLSDAIEGLWPAFQPIVAAKGDPAPLGYEVFARTKSAAFDDPGKFLEAAAAAECIPRLGFQLRKETAAAIAKYPTPPLFFVPLHPKDLFDPRIIGPDEPLLRYANRVVFELTERQLLVEPLDLRERVSDLRALGYRFAINGMGSGAAALVSFAWVEPDYVKLDAALVRGLERSVVQRKLVIAIVKLAQQMSVRVLAEGVETAIERDILASLGCDGFQGPFFGPSEPAP